MVSGNPSKSVDLLITGVAKTGWKRTTKMGQIEQTIKANELWNAGCNQDELLKLKASVISLHECKMWNFLISKLNYVLLKEMKRFFLCLEICEEAEESCLRIIINWLKYDTHLFSK